MGAAGARQRRVGKLVPADIARWSIQGHAVAPSFAIASERGQVITAGSDSTSTDTNIARRGSEETLSRVYLVTRSQHSMGEIKFRLRAVRAGVEWRTAMTCILPQGRRVYQEKDGKRACANEDGGWMTSPQAL